MLSKFKRSKHQQHLAQLPKLPQPVDDVQTLYCPKVFRSTLLELIGQATKRIYLVALYLEQDDAGRDVMSALYQAKQRYSPGHHKPERRRPDASLPSHNTNLH